MKKLFKLLLPLVLVCALIASACWYMFVYDRSTVQEFLISLARNSAEHGNFKTATWFYDLSYQLSQQDEDVAIELSEIYASAGNYTKAESTLSNAIADGATLELYTALCRTYVAQDKLLDAVNLLDSVTDPALKAELDALRPVVPTTDAAPGFYNQYITLNFQHDGQTLYVTDTGDYPSTELPPCAGSVTLAAGETKIYAISVGENGLVSPLAIYHYTVGGVIEEVTLTDPAMESLIREKLMFGADTRIYTSDLWTIDTLTVPAEVADLTDLALMTRLKELTIYGRSIPSLSFLSGMSQLETLTITGCSIGEGLELLGTLPALKSVTLTNCGLSTVAPLANAQLLTHLDLSHNAIADLSPLAAMTAMTRLNLSENAISDVSSLAALAQLTDLDLSHNAITSIVPLTSCAAMQRLDISYNSIVDISAVKTMTGLVSFSAAHNAISTVSALSVCSGLEELDVSHNALTDLGAITGFSGLRTLNFSNNAVTILPDLGASGALVTVYGEHNQLTDVSSLGHMANLNYVYLDYNPELADISFLSNCHQLVQVNVYGTAVPTNSVNALIDQNVIVNFDPT